MAYYFLFLYELVCVFVCIVLYFQLFSVHKKQAFSEKIIILFLFRSQLIGHCAEVFCLCLQVRSYWLMNEQRDHFFWPQLQTLRIQTSIESAFNKNGSKVVVTLIFLLQAYTSIKIIVFTLHQMIIMAEIQILFK